MFPKLPPLFFVLDTYPSVAPLMGRKYSIPTFFLNKVFPVFDFDETQFRLLRLTWKIFFPRPFELPLWLFSFSEGLFCN